MTLDPGLAARLIAAIRTETARRTGCREWDTPGISAALIATEGPPGAVLAAAAIAAEDPTLNKPSATAFKARWHTKAAEPPKVSHNMPCPEHTGQVMPCPRCKAERTGPPAGFFDAVRATLADAPDLSDKAARDRQTSRAEA